MNGQNNSGINKIITVVVVFVVVAVTGLGFYASKKTLASDAYTTSYISTTTTVVVPTKQIASVSDSSFPIYRNSQFGLTVPGAYQVLPNQNQNTYGGVPLTASYNFYSYGVLAFTINVFNKEQWNDIRIQETVNVAEQGGNNSYLNEGQYLGENANWIFSYVSQEHSIPTNISF